MRNLKMIVINSRFLTQPVTGVQRFAIELAKELRRANSEIVFLTPKNIIHNDVANELGAKVLGRTTGHLWEQVELYAYVRMKKALLISLCNTGPLFFKNQIVAIHDISYKICPEWFSKRFVFFYNLLIPQLLKVSKAIVTVSNTSKKELIEKLNVPEEKITVVYNALAPVFQKKELEKKFSGKIPIDCHYILSVSSHHPRKNFNRLVNAFKGIEKDDLKLYIIGNVNKDFKLDKKYTSKNIIYLENIADEELVYYYKFAKLFVFPSLYEGFGIPIIEALSQNTKICVSDIPVFREICGENVTYFDPLDENDIKNKILKSLDNYELFSYNLSRFSWEDGAIKVLKLIKENQS